MNTILMFYFLRKQQYFSWIPNIFYFFNYRKTKYVKTWMYSILWTNSLLKISNNIQLFCIMRHYTTYLYKKIKSYMFYFRKSKDLSNGYKHLLQLTIESISYKRMKTHYYGQYQFFKQWILLFLDSIMFNVRLSSMVKTIRYIIKFFKWLTKSIKWRPKKKRRKKRHSFFVRQCTIIRVRTRRFIVKTSKLFNVRRSFVETLKIKHESDYLKYKLSLFFISTFSMPLKSARLIYVENAKSQNLLTFKDFFLFLDRKLDLFLQNNFHFSIYEVNMLIRYKMLYINDAVITHPRRFIEFGDIIKLKWDLYSNSINNFHNKYKFIPLNLFEKKWFFIFYFLNNIRSFYMYNNFNHILSTTILRYFLKKLFSFKNITTFNNSNLNLTFLKHSFSDNYLELIKGFTNYLIISSKIHAYFWDSLNWYLNIFIEKSVTTIKTFESSTIYSLNSHSKYFINYLTKIYVAAEFYFDSQLFFVNCLRKLNSISLATLLKFLHKFWQSNVRPSKYKSPKRFFTKWRRRRNKYRVARKIDTLNYNIRYKYLLILLLIKYLKIRSLMLNSFFFYKNLHIKLYNNNYFFNSKYIYNFFSLENILSINIFFAKSNSFSYIWMDYTLRLKKQYVKNFGLKYTSMQLKRSSKYKKYSFIMRFRLFSKPLVSKFYNNYYFKYDYYQFPNLYFESSKKKDLFNSEFSLFTNERKYLLYNFYTTLSSYQSNYLISYKNAALVYRFPNKSNLFESKSKWFSTFNLKDLSSKNISNYL